MNYQIEITTRCNYSCLYCSGRHMEQKDMSWDTFLETIKEVRPKDEVSLQGEGEPTLWPHFKQAVLYLKAKQVNLYSILNGTILDCKLIADNFPTIGVSLDSLNEQECNNLGRHYLPKVLRNLKELKKAMPASRINIHTTDYGQDLTKLKLFVKAEGYRHLIQKLQVKEDYTRHYSGAIEKPVMFYTNRSEPMTCDFLSSPRLRYFTVEAVELPCCLIKDARGWPGKEAVRASVESGNIVPWCLGCRNLKKK